MDTKVFYKVDETVRQQFAMKDKRFYISYSYPQHPHIIRQAITHPAPLGMPYPKNSLLQQ